MTKHIHADLMLQYAQDAQETDKPWERWEVYGTITGRWIPLCEYDPFMPKLEYRRKPETITVTLVSGEVVSWPAPHRTELEYGDIYYFVEVDGSVMAEEWDCLEWDKRILADGWVHLTEDTAKQHATALRKINTQGM